MSLIAGLIKAHLGSHKVFAGGDGSFRLNNTASKGKRSNLDFSLYSMIFKTLAPGWVLAEPSRARAPSSSDCRHISLPMSAALLWCLSAGTSHAERQSSVWHSRFPPRELSDAALEALPQPR